MLDNETGAEFFGKYTLPNVADLGVADSEENEVSNIFSMIDFVPAIGTTLGSAPL
jgi:hypothetical protein